MYNPTTGTRTRTRSGKCLTSVLAELGPAGEVNDVRGQRGVGLAQGDAVGQAPHPKALAFLLDELLLDVAADGGTVRVPGAQPVLPFPHSHRHGAGAHLSQGRAWGHGHLPQDSLCFPKRFQTTLGWSLGVIAQCFRKTCKKDKQLPTHTASPESRP